MFRSKVANISHKFIAVEIAILLTSIDKKCTAT